MVDLNVCLEAAVAVAKKAGAMIRSAFEDSDSKPTASWKAVADMVTETDVAVERLVFSDLRAQFPTHSFIGEETAGANEVVGDNPTWVIDPIDGTTNFIHKYPLVCISVALFVDKKPAVGVVFNPVTDELFTAVRGRGAYLNGTQRLSVSSSKSLADALIATNVGCTRDERGASFIVDNISRLLAAKVFSVRMMGTAAMSLAYVAAGRACAFYEWGIHIWDFAAGALLVEEAGGAVLDPSGAPHDMASKRIAAGNPDVLRELVATLLPKTF